MAVLGCFNKGPKGGLPDEQECTDRLLADVITRLGQCLDKRIDSRSADLSECVSRAAPDDPVLILQPADEGFDERLTQISN